MGAMESYLGGSPLFALGVAFGGGVLASLSPCVYPMIPIISSYVVSRAPGKTSRVGAFLLSLSYVAGMAAVYALLGMIAALSGGFFGQVATNPWALLLVAGILLLLALNILEVLRLPPWLFGRVWQPVAGGLGGAFLVGAASGLVASPCTSPVLFGLLTFVATTQNVWFGGALLFAFSLGMGLLLLGVGTFAGLAAGLPKPGAWTLVVKKLLGLLMLSVALYYFLEAARLWR